MYRQGVEMSRAAAGEAIKTRGHCFVCKRRVTFCTDLRYGFPQPEGGCTPNWREQLTCPLCGFNNRTRAAMHLFHQLCNPAPHSRLYLTEQTTPLFAWFQKHYPQTVGSEYLGDAVPAGTMDAAGIRNESLTALSFPDEQFDAILTFDVIEHIPDYLQAFRECLRCLKPGGTLFFSVPFALHTPHHIIRAEPAEDGSIRHLQPPEYHGDPINSQGCLCYYHFGWELLDQLREIGFSQATACLYWSPEYGYLGGEQLLFRAIR